MKNRGRKRLAVLLALIMILGTLPAMTFTSLAEDTGLTGSGTQEDPYRVITGVQLRTAVEKGTAAKPVYIQIAVEEVALEPVGGQADYTFPPAAVSWTSISRKPTRASGKMLLSWKAAP